MVKITWPAGKEGRGSTQHAQQHAWQQQHQCSWLQEACHALFAAAPLGCLLGRRPRLPPISRLPPASPHSMRTVGRKHSGGEVAARAQQLSANGLANGPLILGQQRHQVACKGSGVVPVNREGCR